MSEITGKKKRKRISIEEILRLFLVEDPSEEFADMRDKNDIHYLLEHEGFKGLKAPISRETFDRLHQEYKLTDRQLHRCIEIYLLSNVDKSNEQDYRTYRLQVKDRLYRFNYVSKLRGLGIQMI